jgi:hypothetical protein
MNRASRYRFTSIALGGTILVTAILAANIAVVWSQRAEMTNRDVATSVPDAYKRIYDVVLNDRTVTQLWSGFPHDSISLERTPCEGSCPDYKLTFMRGGKAALTARSWRGRMGNYTGVVDVYNYGKLSYLLKELEFESMASRYTVAATDLPGAIVTVSTGGGMKTVIDYGEVGPIQLWTIQQSIDAVADDIDWVRQ